VATSSSSPACARFDRFSVDLSSGGLLRSGVRVPIQGQPFQVLRLLLEAEGKVVSREELRQALWPEDTFVDFELGVNTAVRKLRQALEDSAEHPKFIETLPKLGYRFMVPVEWVIGNNGKSALPLVEPIAPPEPTPPVPRHWKLKAALALAALAAVALVASLARRAVVGRRVAAQPTVTERRLTANPEDAPVTSSAISPDGRYLAFTDKTGFYLRQVDGGETHAVPLPKGFDAIVESWFPDSTHLVVSWVEDPKNPPSLWEISVMGGTPRKLADAGASARVSPDGSKVAFLLGRHGVEIWLMRADGSEAKRIVGGAETEADDTFSPVAWAPDGRRLAYVRTTDFFNSFAVEEATKIEIVDLASGQSKVVLPKQGLGPALTWTHTGRLIYSLQEAPPNQSDFNLWWVQLDARSALPLGTGTRVTRESGRTVELSATKDGELLALRRSVTQRDVYVAELEAGGKRLDYPFSWTPDSRAVFFVSDRDGPLHIFKQAIDQTQPELLVGGDDDLNIARLTPDGSALLYLVVPKPDESSHNIQIMRVPLTGGPSQFVLQAPGIENQQCARLPSTLCIYSSKGPNQQSFFSFDPMNGTGGLLVTFEGGPFNWSLSPDGKYLATVKLGGQTNPGIQILSLADKTQRTMPVPGWATIDGVDWSADGKSLWVGAFNTKNSWRVEGFLETFALLNIDLDGKVIATLPKGDVSFRWAIPSPDGRRLALEGATYSSNVWLLKNF